MIGGDLQQGETFVPFRKLRGCLVPEAILRNRGLSRGAGQLYGQLSRYAGEDGECYPSQARLAWDFDASERTIQRWLAELVKAQLIRPSRKRGANGRGNRYEFLWMDSLDRGQMLLVARGDAAENQLKTSARSRQNWRVATEPSLCEESTLPRELREVESIPPSLDRSESRGMTTESEETANRYDMQPSDAVAVALILAQSQNAPALAPIPPAPAAIAPPDNLPPPPPPERLKMAPTAEKSPAAPSVSQKPGSVPPKPENDASPGPLWQLHAPIAAPPNVSPPAMPEGLKMAPTGRLGSLASHLPTRRKPPGLQSAREILMRWLK